MIERIKEEKEREREVIDRWDESGKICARFLRVKYVDDGSLIKSVDRKKNKGVGCVDIKPRTIGGKEKRKGRTKK